MRLPKPVNGVSSLGILRSKLSLKKSVKGLWNKYVVGILSPKKEYSLKGSSGVLNNQDGRQEKNIPVKDLFYRKIGDNNMVFSNINEDDEQSK
ncbi:MAG: hypothetical protein QS748_11370 [Candidatus Endonucleobacter bathymodioli]|uniref:Uncharacterized protein n=1 Tax=Candidatus Endonucleibacter bathymodioli TaxID=539814 RepID=A0AA90NUR9_9GAMM|nr:hypothetical protein [Candidatus Endonucleobacter bathymodioli]